MDKKGLWRVGNRIRVNRLTHIEYDIRKDDGTFGAQRRGTVITECIMLSNSLNSSTLVYNYE